MKLHLEKCGSIDESTVLTPDGSGSHASQSRARAGAWPLARTWLPSSRSPAVTALVLLAALLCSCSKPAPTEDPEPELSPELTGVADQIRESPPDEREGDAVVLYFALLQSQDEIGADRFAAAVFDSGLHDLAQSVLERYDFTELKGLEIRTSALDESVSCDETCAEQTSSAWGECGLAASKAVATNLLGRSSSDAIVDSLEKVSNTETTIDVALTAASGNTTEIVAKLVDVVGTKFVETAGGPVAAAVLAAGKAMVECGFATLDAQLELEQCREIQPLLCKEPGMDAGDAGMPTTDMAMPDMGAVDLGSDTGSDLGVPDSGMDMKALDTGADAADTADAAEACIPPDRVENGGLGGAICCVEGSEVYTNPDHADFTDQCGTPVSDPSECCGSACYAKEHDIIGGAYSCCEDANGPGFTCPL